MTNATTTARPLTIRAGLRRVAQRFGLHNDTHEFYKYDSWWSEFDVRHLAQWNVGAHCLVCGQRIYDQPAYHFFSRKRGTRNEERREAWVCKPCLTGVRRYWKRD